MSKKLDKLKEVNATLNEILIKLETYIFIENINIDSVKKINEEKQRVVVEIKR